MRTLLSALLLAASTASAQGARTRGWQADLDTLVARVQRVHPRPWAHTSREAFLHRAAALRASVPAGTDGQLLAGMMRLIASLEDGHSFIADLGAAGGTWFPVRFYLLDDGLWITAIDSVHVALAGGRVTRVGSVSADSAVAAILALCAGDNAPGRREGVAYLANAVLLQALGVTPDTRSLALVTTKGSAVLSSVVTGKGDVSWSQYGEITGPPDVALVTAFGGRTSAGFREPLKNADLPLHLRGRRAYWWTVLPSDSTVYFALNNVVAKSSFSRFTLMEELGQALAHVDSAPSATTRFILDLRYNSGGDGSLTPAIVNEFVKRDASIGRRGRFFVITGRKTFSAAAGTVLDLLHHTNAILVGEPMGVAFNASGDAGHSTLPNHGVEVSLSTNATFTTNLEGVRIVPLQVPASMTGEAYFAGRDPSLEAILSQPAPYPEVLTTLQERGAATARSLWTTLQARFGTSSWWEPFTYESLNALGYRLLADKRGDDAVAAFQLNAERFPARWEPWDSLGDAYRETGRVADARASYQRALRLAPDNWNADYQRRMLRELAGTPPR